MLMLVCTTGSRLLDSGCPRQSVPCGTIVRMMVTLPGALLVVKRRPVRSYHGERNVVSASEKIVLMIRSPGLSRSDDIDGQTAIRREVVALQQIHDLRRSG